MRRRWVRLFDIGAALLFFGALAQQTELHQTAQDALSQLEARGYRIPDENNPVRIFPALTSGAFSGAHAGGWRPGIVYLRQQPQNGLDEVYLRHELFHEANYRSCDDRLPAWANEAAAMSFSGELAGQSPGGEIGQAELLGLKASIRLGAELDSKDRMVLGRLLANTGWPVEPCELSKELAELLGTTFPENGDRAYLLMHIVSGRILESAGDMKSRLPPGSLLKIPYAAALRQANPEILAIELANSDTDKLLQRRSDFDAEKFRLLLTAIPGQQLAVQAGLTNQQDWRAYLGERGAGGDFAVQANLPELALAMRAALLARPDYFLGLSQNGVLPNSTLARQALADKKLLQQMLALAKTGTVSSPEGQPLVGNLLVAWPAEHPQYLALFRQRGVSGATLLRHAAKVLREWRQTYPLHLASVRVSLLSSTHPSSWEAQADCPEWEDLGRRISVCGEFRIISTARGSRTERQVRGILYPPKAKQPAVLETDVDSYADAVLSAEAQGLSGSARQAMRAVIAWNGSHGNHRHTTANSLCDTTHCMVFLGESPATKPPAGKLDRRLLQFVDKLASASDLHWLPFANGGDERWQRHIPAGELRHVLAEQQILDIRRERRRNGDVVVRLVYAEHEETLGCEVFRNALKLPSCPDAISVVSDQVWQFTGIGAGHGLGLSIVRAQALAESGRTAEQILLDAYQGSR